VSQCADEVAPGAQQYNWFTEGFDTADLKEARGAPGRVERLTNDVLEVRS
jgi:hypothetical protein